MRTTNARILTHHNATHFKYSLAARPWDGPVRRAIEALTQAQPDQIMSVEGFLDHFKTHYAEYYKGLDWVTFSQFTPQGTSWMGQKLPFPGFEMRLALIYLQPDPKLRTGLFQLRQQITSETGWYPLVQGKRAATERPNYKRFLPRSFEYGPSNRNEFALGELISMRNVSVDVSGDNGNPKKGNAFLVEGSLGSLLMDTGFAVDLTSTQNAQAVFLSHFHGDHAGGLWQFVEQSNAPIILSEATLTYLCQKKGVSTPLAKKLIRNAHIIEEPSMPLRVDGDIRFFPTYHAPGSYGMVYRNPQGQAIFYPGDICLRNGFLNKYDDLLSFIRDFDAEQKYVLLDGAMVRREDFSIEVEDTPVQILEEFQTGVQRRNVIFVSQSEEASIYTFILAFKYTNKGPEIPFLVVNDMLFELTRRLIRPVLKRDFKGYDPFVESVLKRDIINFIESYRVFPMSALPNFGPQQKLIIFATKADLKKNETLKERVAKSDVIIAGVQALSEDVELFSLTNKCRLVHRVASSDWSFHSSGEDMAEFIRDLSAINVRSILFHGGSDALKKYITKNSLDKKLVSVISHKSLSLNP